MTLFTLDPTCNIEHALKMVEGTLNVSESFIFGRSSKFKGSNMYRGSAPLLILTLESFTYEHEELFQNIPFALKERTKESLTYITQSSKEPPRAVTLEFIDKISA